MMNNDVADIHPSFAGIRADAIAAFGEPTSDRFVSSETRQVDWGHIALQGTPVCIFFFDEKTDDAWWVVDGMTGGSTVSIDYAINAIRPLLAR
jgi:hypothetical protein